MPYWEDNYEDRERDEEPEPQEVPTVELDTPQSCHVCGTPDCTNGCFRCGKPVCYNQKDYFSDTECGAWILDTWHNEHPEGNEYYCNPCLKEAYSSVSSSSEQEESPQEELEISHPSPFPVTDDDDEDLGELDDFPF